MNGNPADHSAAARGNKRFVALCAAAVLALALLSGTIGAAVAGAEQYIGEAKAKAVALDHAGITWAQATFLRAHPDHEDGRTVYDVAFYSGSTEYDYEIDAVTGAIREADRDIEYYSVPRQPAAADSSGYIGEARAKAIALGHAGVEESETASIAAWLDRDDGRVDYEVEFYAGNTEYEYEIDASSGRILGFDRDTRDRAPRQSSPAASESSGSYIGEARAKSIALTSAGLKESELSYISVHLDRDDGRIVYDLEFRQGRMEYEYSVDAFNGAILEADSEYDD